jgi:hypothetical protein
MQVRIDDADEPKVPSHLVCPISLEVMRDPVTGPTGITYDWGSVEAWLLDRGRATCPVTGLPLRADELIPNHATRRVIQNWCVAHPGVERVPMPRVPVSAADLLAAAAKCGQLPAWARALGKESERNRRCLAAAGASRALSSAFAQIVDHSTRLTALTASGGTLAEILAALIVFFPLDEVSRSRIASPASLNAVVSILMTHDQVAARASAVVVLREIASSSDAQCLHAMSRTNGMYDALVKVLEKPISPQATKAALVTAY